MSRKTVEIELKMPIEVIERLVEVARLAGTTYMQVAKVLLALQVVQMKQEKK